MNKALIYALCSSMEEFKKNKKLSDKSTIESVLKEFGYEFSYVRVRTFTEAMANSYFLFIKNELNHDITCYESSCPKNLIDWYYEFSRLIECDEPDEKNNFIYSEDTLRILVSGLFLEPELKTINEKNNTASIINEKYNVDPAIYLFILNNVWTFPEIEKKDIVGETEYSNFFEFFKQCYFLRGPPRATARR
jgi:hypothetical protein